MRLLAACVLWLLPMLAAPVQLYAQPAPRAAATIDALVVEGNLRVEAAAVLRESGLAVGQAIEPRRLGEAIRRIYALDWFDDIQIDARATDSGVTLVVVVTEKPSVSAVVFRGNDRLDDEDLTEEIGVRVDAILDRNRVREGAARITDLYREKGYYMVEVTPLIEASGPGTVQVVYDITEAARVRVERVNIVGNEQIEEEHLRRFLFTRPGTLLSFLNQTGRFNEAEFENDLQRLRYVYYEEGFLDVSVGSPTVELSRDLSGIYVTIPLVEGDPYSVSDVSVSGDMLLPQEELMERFVRTEAGETFRSSSVRGDIERITEHYRNAGYAHANVNMLTRQDADADTVGLQYDIEQGELCYIGRIEVIGNSLTRDRVVRRELLISEGDRYHGTYVDRSSESVLRLGIFEDVQVREIASRSNPRIIDLQIEVVERPTRSLQVGAGFSSVDSFMATAEIRENNLFGRAQSLTLNAQLSARRSIFVLELIEPYFLDSRVLLSLDLFRREEIFPSFERESQGFGLGFGYRPFWRSRFWRDLQFQWGYQLEDVGITSASGTRSTLSGAARRSRGGLTSRLESGVSFDRRNDRIMTTRGSYHFVNFEVADATLGSDNEFYRLRAATQWYASPSFLECGTETGELGMRRRTVSQGVCRWLSSWVGRLKLEFGQVGTTNPNKDVPIYERFFVGGPTSVRGFERFTLSPTAPGAAYITPESTLRDELVGGHRQLVLNVEIEFPLVNVLGLRGVLFFDAGNSFEAGEPVALGLDWWEGANAHSLRTSVGWGFRWRSPIGPLRFEWGYPLVRAPGERRAVFEFSIQNSF